MQGVDSTNVAKNRRRLDKDGGDGVALEEVDNETREDVIAGFDRCMGKARVSDTGSFTES